MGYVQNANSRTLEYMMENIIDQAMEDLQKRDLTKNFLHCRDKLNVKPNYKSGK
jgi:hypothetical protein